MIDITALWRVKHSHLQPFAQFLPIPDNQYFCCPTCGGLKAFHLLADLQVRAGEWLRSAKVLYCPTCLKYQVDDQNVADKVINIGAQIIDIDARIWSASPSFLDLEPTTRCNYKCWYCIGRHMQQADVNFSDFVSILEHADGINTLALVGEGEPLLHPQIFDMAALVRDTGRKTMMISNGSQFTQSNIERLCETGVTYIAISIDSTQHDYFTQSRIHGNLDEVLRGMARLRKYRDSNGYMYPKIGIKGTLLNYNEDEMIAIVKLARDYGADIFESFQPLNPKYSYVSFYPEEQQEQLSSIANISRTISEQNHIARELLQPCDEFMSEEGIVFGGQDRINSLRNHCDERYIYALLSGDITPCCQVKTIVDSAWNLIERPLSEILSDPTYQNMRFNLWNGLFADYCAGCSKTCE